MSRLIDREARSVLEPIPSVEAAQQAAAQIRKAIVTGRYKPGERLIERDLTEQLNVSRHPVREALRILAREGFVELHRNRGAQVSRVEASQVTEVYAIRMALGALALERLIGVDGSLDAPAVSKLEVIMRKALDMARIGKHDDAVEADLDFQQAIVDLSSLDRVQRYFKELTDDVRRFSRTLGIIYTDQENYVQLYIVRLFDAISRRDLERARGIWRSKLEKAIERFTSALAGETLDGVKRIADADLDC